MKCLEARQLKYFLLIAGLMWVASAFSQPGNFYIRNFPQSDHQSENYTASPANSDVIEDSRGVIYTANTTDILELDGVNWREVKASDQLENGNKSFAINSEGRIFVGAKNKIGFLIPDTSGLIGFKSLSDNTNIGEINNTLCIHDTVYFVSDSVIYSYAQHHLSLVQCQ